MDAIHAVELDMLKAVADLCEKYDIRYTLYCGTLLGAVRHGGFIPWDDDIDIAMPLKDYRRFQEVADELPSRFVCDHPDNNPKYYLPWMKIKANGTTSLDPWYAALDMHWGLFLDIYPFVGAASTERGIRLQNWILKTVKRIRSAELYRARREKSLFKKLLWTVPYPVRRAVCDALMKIVMKDPEKCEMIGTIDAVPFDGKFAREDWQEMTRLKFEDREFSAPAN